MDYKLCADRTIQRQRLVNAFSARQTQLSTLDERFWTIIGPGPIGAKAEELRRKAWAIEQTGFELYPRVVLAMGFFHGFRDRNGITSALERGAPSEELKKLAKDGRFSGSEWETIRSIAKRFEGAPVAVRSSAHGDCRGTGIYHSGFSVNNAGEKINVQLLKREIRKVLASEFSKDAIVFRRDLGLGNGMAVIIEPVFGQRFKFDPERDLGRIEYISNCFGPCWGGVAYSSTSSGKGSAVVARGLPTRAVNGNGLLVLAGQHAPLFEIALRAVDKIAFGNLDMVGIGRYASHLKEFSEWGTEGDLVELTARRHPLIRQELQSSGIDSQRLEWLFTRLSALEKLVNRPQYVEWAVLGQKEPRAAIIQIADCDPKTDVYEFAETEKTLMKSFYAVGSGVRICDEVVFIWNPNDYNLLEEYNSTHRDYVLIYAGRLTSSALSGGARLGYSYLSNASVLIELPYNHSPAQHWGGALKETGKLLLVAEDIRWDILDKIAQIRKNGQGGTIRIHPLKVRVTASERQQKGIVELVD